MKQYPAPKVRLFRKVNLPGRLMNAPQEYQDNHLTGNPKVPHDLSETGKTITFDPKDIGGNYVFEAKCGTSTKQITVTAADAVTFEQSDDLWWFNGEDPSRYHISVTIQANGGCPGTYTWKVTAGADKVDLRNGGTTADEISGPQLRSIEVISTAPSGASEDVTIELKIDGVLVGEHKLTVFAPETLVLKIPNINQVAHPSGFRSRITYRIKDQFDETLPRHVEWNEDIDGNGMYSNAGQVSAAAISDWAGENWSWGEEDGWLEDPNAAQDTITRRGGASWIPPALHPQNPLGGEKVDHSPEGTWYVGSTAIGKGVKVKDGVTWQIYRDHADHE